MNQSNSASNKAFFRNFSSVIVKDQPLVGAAGSEIILISINHTGTRLVNSRTDKSLRIWKCTSDRLIEPTLVENAHTKPVESISWNPRTEYSFASVGRDDTIKIWKGLNGTLEKEIKVVKENSSAPTVCQIVRYSADGEVLSVVDRDSTLIFYSVLENYRKIEEMRLNEHIYDFSWFNHGHSFFNCALHDGTIPVYKYSENEKPILKCSLSGHRSSATSICMDPRGQYFAVGSTDGVVSIWSTSSLLNSKIISKIDEAISHIDVSRDGTYIAVAYDSGSNIRIFDSESTEEVFEVPNSSNPKLGFGSIAWYPNKTGFVFTSDSAKTMTLMRKPEK